MYEDSIEMENFHKKMHMGDHHGVELARAYVPYQKLDRIFNPEEGLKKGTVFPELYQPYEAHGKKCACAK